MAEIRDITAYILSRVPGRRRLSNARLTKMVYLADWKSAIETRKTISNIKWYYDNFGPFVWDVVNTARQNPLLFNVTCSADSDGNRRTFLSLADRRYKARLDRSEAQSVDHIIQVTKDLDWPDFIRLVYSTYPIASRQKFQELDLVALADEYADYQAEVGKAEHGGGH